MKWYRLRSSSSVREVVYFKVGLRDFSFTVTHKSGMPWEVRGSHFGGFPGDEFPVISYTVEHYTRRGALKAARVIARTLVAVTARVGG